MHAIRPACTIFAIRSSLQLRWGQEEREFRTGKTNSQIAGGCRIGAFFGYDKRERMLEARVVDTKVAKSGGKS